MGEGEGGAWAWGGGEGEGERSGAAAAPFIIAGTRAPGGIGRDRGSRERLRGKGMGVRGEAGSGYAGAAAATAMPARVWGFMRGEMANVKRKREGGRGGSLRWGVRGGGGGGGGARADTTTKTEETKRISFSLFFISFRFFSLLALLSPWFSNRAPGSFPRRLVSRQQRKSNHQCTRTSISGPVQKRNLES